jgi:hypothetical protein
MKNLGLNLINVVVIWILSGEIFFQMLDVLNFSNSSEDGMLLLSGVQKQWSELIFSRQMNSLMS